MIYLLGGPPRVGKSIISKTITKKYEINVVSTDSLGAVLENVLDPESEPGLFGVNRFNEMTAEQKDGDYFSAGKLDLPKEVIIFDITKPHTLFTKDSNRPQKPSEIQEVTKQALDNGRPTIIDIVIDPDEAPSFDARAEAMARA